MANGNVYTQAGEEVVIDALDTALGTTWAFQSGIGVTTPAKGDTALANATGCPAKAYPASPSKSQPTADKLQLVGTIAYTSTLAITELGLFKDASTGALIQRHVFDAINVVSGDSIEFTVTHEQA